MRVRLILRYQLVFSVNCFVLFSFSSFRRSFSYLPVPRPRSPVRNHLLFTLLPCSRRGGGTHLAHESASVCITVMATFTKDQQTKWHLLCMFCYTTNSHKGWHYPSTWLTSQSMPWFSQTTTRKFTRCRRAYRHAESECNDRSSYRRSSSSH